MKLSIGSRFLDYIEDMDARFARLKELGFDAMDFNLWQLHQPCYESVEKMEAYCKQARAAAEKNGVEIYQTHGPWPTDDRTPESRAIGWQQMHLGLYGTYLLGCKYMVIHPQMPYGRKAENEDSEFAESLTIQLMEELLPDCEKYGVTLCLENMPFISQRISATPRIVEVVKKMNSPYVQICYDTGHSNAKMKEDIPACVAMVAPYLKTLHVHDNWYNDEHYLPFMGMIDWDAFAKALAESGYEGTLNLELGNVPHQMGPELREAYIKQTVETAKALNQMIEDYKK